jgi:hypothetical protein
MSSRIKKLLKRGGYLTGKGRDGKTVKLSTSKKGGYAVGAAHGPEGGIKGEVGTEKKPIEFEGDEIIITKKAARDNTLHEFEGKQMTKRQILSAINVDAGGVSFAKGGTIPGKIRAKKNASYKVGGQPMSAHDVVKHCGCGCAHAGQKMQKGGTAGSLLPKIKKLIKDNPDNSYLQLYKKNPEDLIRDVQEQATGYHFSSNQPGKPKAYEALVETLGQDIVLQCVRAMPEKIKYRIFTSWKGVVVHPDLRNAVRPAAVNGNSPKYAAGGKTMGEAGLHHALLNTVSAGTIASLTGLSRYKDIDEVRVTAVQMLNRDGDKKYSINVLKELLKQAGEEWKENKHEMKFAAGGKTMEVLSARDIDNLIIGLKEKYCGIHE